MLCSLILFTLLSQRVTSGDDWCLGERRVGGRMPRNDTLAVDTQSTKVWGKMLGGNPVPWLLSSDEPAARWVTLTAVLDREQTDPAVLEARQQVVAGSHLQAGRASAGVGLKGPAVGTRQPGIRAPSAQPACRHGRTGG